MSFKSSPLVSSSSSLLPLQWLQLCVKQPGHSSSPGPGLLPFGTICTSLSYQLAWGGSWHIMRISNFEPQQTKSKGRKLCCSSISSFILCHSVKKLLHLQVGQQYNLIHSIHAVFLPLHMYVCPGKPSLLAPSGVMLRSFQYCSIRAGASDALKLFVLKLFVVILSILPG